MYYAILFSKKLLAYKASPLHTCHLVTLNYRLILKRVLPNCSWSILVRAVWRRLGCPLPLNIALADSEWLCKLSRSEDDRSIACWLSCLYWGLAEIDSDNRDTSDGITFILLLEPWPAPRLFSHSQAVSAGFITVGSWLISLVFSQAAWIPWQGNLGARDHSKVVKLSNAGFKLDK